MKNKFSIASYIVLTITSLFIVYELGVTRNDKEEIKKNKIAKLENRINNLQQAMQTKDRELEAGMRNNYTGLMHKIEFIERETGVSE